MNDVRPTVAAVVTLFAALNLAKCSQARGLAFRSVGATTAEAPSCCACAAGCMQGGVR
jgi:hypothetical protein